MSKEDRLEALKARLQADKSRREKEEEERRLKEVARASVEEAAVADKDRLIATIRSVTAKMQEVLAETGHTLHLNERPFGTSDSSILRVVFVMGEHKTEGRIDRLDVSLSPGGYLTMRFGTKNHFPAGEDTVTHQEFNEDIMEGWLIEFIGHQASR